MTKRSLMAKIAMIYKLRRKCIIYVNGVFPRLSNICFLCCCSFFAKIDKSHCQVTFSSNKFPLPLKENPNCKTDSQRWLEKYELICLDISTIFIISHQFTTTPIICPYRNEWANLLLMCIIQLEIINWGQPSYGIFHLCYVA